MGRETHQNEIIASRSRGFGGSDAAMVAKVAIKGLQSLSRTDINRILCVLGKEQPREIPVTAAMQAGHDFEDWLEDDLRGAICQKSNAVLVREEVLRDERSYRHFEVFAHADFVLRCDGTATVYECKYSQLPTEEVADTYRWQLQWYYMLGLDAVNLVHGWGAVFPFEVSDYRIVATYRDEDAIRVLRDGLCVLDAAMAVGYFDEMSSEAATLGDLSEGGIVAMAELRQVLVAMDKMKSKEAELREQLKAEMEANGILSLKGDGFTVTYVAPTTRKTFDAKKAQGVYPDLKNDMYYKTSSVGSSIKITLK